VYLVADYKNNRIQQCPSSGTGKCVTVVEIESPRRIAVLPDGDLVITAGKDRPNVTRCPWRVTVRCVDIVSDWKLPTGVAITPGGDIVVVDRDSSISLRLCPAQGGQSCVSLVQGQAAVRIYDAAVAPNGDYITHDGHGAVDRWDVQTLTGKKVVSRGYHCGSAVVALNGDYVFVEHHMNRVVRCNSEGQSCKVIAGGNGQGAAANQLNAWSVRLLNDSEYILADVMNQRVQRCPADGSGACTTVAGGNGKGAADNQFDGIQTAIVAPA